MKDILAMELTATVRILNNFLMPASAIIAKSSCDFNGLPSIHVTFVPHLDINICSPFDGYTQYLIIHQPLTSP